MRQTMVLPVLVLLMVSCALAQPRAGVQRQQLQVQPVARLTLTDQARLQELRRILQERNVDQKKRESITQQFSRLPLDLQDTLLVASSARLAQTAEASGLVQRDMRDLVRPVNRELLKFRIWTLWPAEGTSPDHWVVADGVLFDSSVTIKLNGADTPSYWLGYDDNFLPDGVAFKMPASSALGSTIQVTAHKGTTASDPVPYKVVAPRGYRGWYGWKFANFGDSTIPWQMYRDFFGASAVEYGNGTHKPSAQTWYDSAYKGVGGGGNCYGMSVSSLRHRQSGITTFWNSWFTNPANKQTYVWFYPWATETKQTVQEDQGGQLSAEMASYINTYYNSQTHKDVFNRVASLTGGSGPKPVLGMWSGNGGHAIVPYGTKIVGNDYQMTTYDNNAPYAETETGGPDKSLAHVNWTNSSFSYGGYIKAVCMSYAECLTPPHLPAAAAGTMGAVANGTTICVLAPGTEVTQITDENGRRFFAANGTPELAPANRISNSMRFIPLTGAPQTANDPLIFIFGNSQGKSLTFDLRGRGLKNLSVFQPGTVMTTDFQGAGQIRLANILTPTRELNLPNPAQLRPTQVRVIQSLAIGDRAFDLLNLQNLGPQGLRVLPAVDGSALEVQSALPVQFDLQVAGPQGQGMQQVTFPGVVTQAATRAVLQPANWQNLRGAGLNLQIRALQGNQLQQQRTIQPR
ncbi:MAG: hypothetical protein ABFE08_21280 [Armatimonadia bacterium]